MEQVRLVWLCIYDNIVGVNVHFSLLVCYICAPVNILPQGGDFEQERWPRSGVSDHNFIFKCSVGILIYMTGYLYDRGKNVYAQEWGF